MPNLAKLLKDEIVRLARRELKSQTAALQRASTRQRKDIAALKRQQLQTEKALKALAKHGGKATAAVMRPEPEGKAGFRFRADGFRALRERLGISAEQMGKLLGVSGQSVYGWEQKKTTPRRSQLPAIAAVRAMGKRAVAERLAQAKK
ncbi:MAG: helix-turn-helix transcriptional regulator [Rudaea sp.]|uniref:helix-turn-helix domain-containing protein n=1 Tax=unclassified Rudaea TaxID=2627037 RepID=UPI0010F72407|nr:MULTISPECIES: helix-turn-helix transcriptional regulator [unclassified Rudaea]MBN8884449.1 helix-turn-helix transcriptional regulator [Rudaea sp.]